MLIEVGPHLRTGMEPPGGLNRPLKIHDLMDDAFYRAYKDLEAFPQSGTLDGYIVPAGAGPPSRDRDQDQRRKSKLVPARPPPPPPTKVSPPHPTVRGPGTGPAPPPVPPRTRGPLRRQLSSMGTPVPARRLTRSATQVDTYVSNGEKVYFLPE